MSKVSDFCKLYRTRHGQVLVKLDHADDAVRAEVRFYYTAPDYGVCSVAVKYNDSDEGWDAAEAYFARVGKAEALRAIEPGLLLMGAE